jgi:hypothetical protein
VLDDQASVMHGDDADALRQLESDPRYLIGRLQQALTALLKCDTPPLEQAPPPSESQGLRAG